MSMWFYHLVENIQGSEFRTIQEPNQLENNRAKKEKKRKKALDIKWKYRPSCFPFSWLSFLVFLFYSIGFKLFHFWTCFWQWLAFCREQMLGLDWRDIAAVWIFSLVVPQLTLHPVVSHYEIWAKRTKVFLSPSCAELQIRQCLDRTVCKSGLNHSA